MNKFVLVLAFIAWMAAFKMACAGMVDEKGKVNDKQYDTIDLNSKLIKVQQYYGLFDVTRHCDLQGYFIYGGTIYQCVKIREGITQAELRDYAREEIARIKARRQEILKSRSYDQKHK